MKNYVSEFEYGKSLLKKIIIAAAFFCVLALIASSYPTYQAVFSILTVVCFILAIVVDVKYCRCKHCGKVVFLGVLAVTSCPRCKRSLTTGKKVKKSK